MVSNIVLHDQDHAHIPDYSIAMDEDMVTFTSRGSLGGDAEGKGNPSQLSNTHLAADTYLEARQAAPGWDIYVLEGEWRHWMAEGGLDAPKNPDKAFMGFCKKWFERRGRP